jgi:hypothetical protein
MTGREMSFDNSIVANMIEEALAFCAAKTRTGTKENALDCVLQGDCSACEYVRYGLAKGIAQYLGSIDDTVKALYIYEPEYATNDDTVGLSLGIHLLAWVERKSAALNSMVAGLDAALMEERKRLLCPEATAECFSLDVKVADDDEVRRRRGYGALVNSIFVRPTKVWERSNEL